MGAEPEDAPTTPRSGAAAVMIQKTYRGYRARRKLADAAIMSKSVGVGWWNVVDSVVLREHTLHYFAHSKSWKPHDNWKRLKRKASKVGKGLEKNNKALKLALQHWLEAVDARHRYGHNLRPYYLHWVELETNEPFFYWLDLGSGRHVELPKCTRATLLDQQITYLSPEQRRHYEVSIYKGKLFYKLSGELVHTGTAMNRWIFVMSPHGGFYIGKKVKGVFQHSSFLAGGATTAAGRLIVEHGVLKLMEAHSGHYRPSPENFEALVHVLIASGADLHLAKVQLVSDDLLEKRKAKTLAQEVRQGIEHAGAEAHVGVTIHNQRFVTVDSGSLDGSMNEYLVTNLTFPEFTHSSDMAQKRAEEEEEEEEANTRPVCENQSKNDEATANFTKNGATIPDQSQIRVRYEASTVPDQPQITVNYEAEKPSKDQMSVQEGDHKEIPAVTLEKLTGPTSTPALTSTSTSVCASAPTLVSAPAPASVSTSDSSASVSGPGSSILKKKPSALVLPSVGAMSIMNPNIPRTPTIPTSPGFSRNASLAVLTPQERRHTLKTYGPKKSPFAPTPKKQ